MTHEDEVDALSERIEILDITIKVLGERIQAIYDKLESLQKMVDE